MSKESSALLATVVVLLVFVLLLGTKTIEVYTHVCLGPMPLVSTTVDTTPPPLSIDQPLFSLNGAGTKVMSFIDLTGLKRYLLITRARVVLTNPSLKNLKYKVYCWLNYASENTVKEFVLKPREVREVEIDASLEVQPAKERKPFRLYCVERQLAPMNQIMVMFTKHKPAGY